jgi:hypothetical protein
VGTDRLPVLMLLAAGSLGACGEILSVDGEDKPPAPSTPAREAGADAGALVPSNEDGGGGISDAADACQSLGCASKKCSAARCEPLIFVTIQTFNGAELGGDGGDPGFKADKACRDEGKLLSSTSTFFAWIAGPGGGPFTRGLRLVPRFYWTPGTDGAVELVGTTSAALQNGLLHVIQRRDGSTAPAPVRTNVRADGTTIASAVQETCDMWRSGLSSSLGAIGVPASLRPGVWAAHLESVSYLVAACDSALPLYCVEDATP